MTARVSPERTAATRALGSVLAAACLAGTALPAGAQTLSWTGSVNYSTGSYIFDRRSNAIIVHNGIGFSLDRFRVTAGLPIVWQNSFAVNLVGDTWIPTGGPDSGVLRGRGSGQTVPTGHGRRSGPSASSFATVVDTVAIPDGWELSLADPLVSGAVEVWSGWGALRSIEVQGAVKPPVASIESGVGTGAWDWNAGASIVLAAGSALLFADAGWWRNGDMPDLVLNDGLSWGIGAGLPVGNRFSLLATLTGSERIIDTVDSPLSLSVMGAHTAGGRALHAGVTAGLSEASPDVVVFAGWRLDLFRRNPFF